MQKIMYAIVEKTTREIMKHDWDGYGSETFLIESSEKDARGNLSTLAFCVEEDWGNKKFANTEVVSVTLTWE